MKIGDLVRWKPVKDNWKRFIDHGIILSLSRSGASSLHAEILFEDNTVEWVATETLEVISDNSG